MYLFTFYEFPELIKMLIKTRRQAIEILCIDQINSKESDYWGTRPARGRIRIEFHGNRTCLWSYYRTAACLLAGQAGLKAFQPRNARAIFITFSCPA